jgi:PAS domain S-box-containing protein
VLSFIDYKKIPRHLVIVFLLITIAATALGYYYYQIQKSQIRQRIENELEAIASLKADLMVNWRKERLGDAATIIDDSFIVPDIRRFLVSRDEPEIRARILRWMRSFMKSDQYENLLLFNTDIKLRLSVNAERPGFGPDAARLVGQAIATKKSILSDLYLSRVTGNVRQSLAVPLMSGNGNNAVCVGVVLLRINPEDFIYPMLKRWPAQSATAETMLIRREGNEAVFLSRVRNGSALTLRLPIDTPSLPAAAAARGEEGIVEGVDYGGVKVLAAIKSVHGSPWHIVAKVDMSEIFAPLYELGWRMALLVLGLICGSLGSIALVWRNQAAKYYRAQYESELSRVALLRHYEPLTRHANDSIMLFDAEGNILEANEKSSSMLGYPLEELLHMNVRTIGTTCAILDMDDLGKQLNLSEEKGVVYESEYLRKDGSRFPVEVSLRAFEIEGRTFFQTIIRDITERKKSELRINAMNALLELFMKKTSRKEYLASVANLLRIWSGCRTAGIRMLDRSGYIQYESYVGFNCGFLDSENWLSVRDDQCTCIRVVLGVPDELEAEYTTQRGSFRCDDLALFMNKLSPEARKKFRGRCFTEGFRSLAVIPIRYQDSILGAIHLADEKDCIISAEALDLIETMSPLIGEAICRFSTEEALKLSEEHYRSLIESSSDCIYQLTLDGDYLSMNSKMHSFLDSSAGVERAGNHFAGQVSGKPETVLKAINRAGHGETTPVRYRSIHRQGTEVWWDAVLSPVKDLDGNVISILGISRDITERIRAEEELRGSHARLRKLSAHLQSITEEERTRIAREVHDELGQVLTALKMDTAWLAKRLPSGNQELHDKAGNMLKLIDDVIQSVKRICTELRPTLLDHLGISAAIEWQAEEFRKRTGLDLDLHLYSVFAGKHVSTMLFRVLQEALTNVSRHAQATKVKVMLRKEGPNIIMRITDNGKGIKREHLRKPQSFGLLGMKERVHSIGGSFSIRGIRNGGTSIKVTVPAEENQDIDAKKEIM